MIQLVGTRWRLKEVLEARGVTGYKLAQQTTGKLSRNQIYALANTNRPKALYLETLDAIIDGLKTLGHDVAYDDLLEYVPDTDD